MLGDAIIGYIVSCIVFLLKEEFQVNNSGGMTEVVSWCVSNSTFAAVAVRKLELETHIRYSPSLEFQIEQFSNQVNNLEGSAVHGKNPPKVIADVFEALVAAIYIDSNYDMTVVYGIFWPLLKPYAMSEGKCAAMESEKDSDPVDPELDFLTTSLENFSINDFDCEVKKSISLVDTFLGGLAREN